MSKEEVRLVKPGKEHFKAFRKAQKAMYDYIGADVVRQYQNLPEDERENFSMEDTAKRESLDFSFTDAWYDNIDEKQFEEKFVQFYENKRAPGAKRPQEFYFMMVGDEIAGEISARSRKMDDLDTANGVKPHAKWGNNMAVEVGMCMLPEFRGGGRGYANKAKEQLFDILRAQGVEEITGTVVHSNIISHKSQKRSLEKYGGYTIEVPEGTRYVFSSDTSGNSVDKYKDRSPGAANKTNQIKEKIESLKNKINLRQGQKTGEEQKATAIDLTAMARYQNKKQKGE